jgi:hypothetical protein
MVHGHHCSDELLGYTNAIDQHESESKALLKSINIASSLLSGEFLISSNILLAAVPAVRWNSRSESHIDDILDSYLVLA